MIEDQRQNDNRQDGTKEEEVVKALLNLVHLEL